MSEFRAAATTSPDNERGVAVEFTNGDECNAFLKQAEAEFVSRRFTNSADAFDAVKAWVLQRASERF